jgi:uncharacterized membrane protein
MIERLLLVNGYLSTALLAYGLLALWWAPDAYWSVALHAGLLMLVLTPVTRVLVASGRYLRAGDWFSAALTAGILAILALSAWAAAA